MKSLEIDYYDGKAPFLMENQEVPKLTYYPSSDKKADGCVVICPGGGYCIRAPHEGVGYAEFLNAHGMDAFVVDYRVKPYLFPCALLDSRRAIRYVRSNAEKFGINPDKIAIMGSSAGAHLAALTSTYKGSLDGEGIDDIDNVDCFPNLQILCYPVLDIMGHPGSFRFLLGENIREHDKVTPTSLVDKNTPPAFIWHTFKDDVVDIRNTYRYAIKLRDFGVVTELHVYPYGHHGLGLDPNNEVPYLQNWGDHLIDWLKLNNFYL